MRKVATFFAIATAVVVMSSCGSKTAESTESTDTVTVETTIEPAMDTTTVITTDTMTTDTTAHTH